MAGGVCVDGVVFAEGVYTGGVAVECEGVDGEVAVSVVGFGVLGRGDGNGGTAEGVASANVPELDACGRV